MLRPKQILWETLDIDTKSTIMQKAFGKYDYGLLSKESRERCDLQASRDTVLAWSSDVVMGMSSLSKQYGWQ